jgi:hypothetical protein
LTRSRGARLANLVAKAASAGQIWLELPARSFRRALQIRVVLMRFSASIIVAASLISSNAWAHPGVHEHGVGWSSLIAHSPILAPAALIFAAGLLLFRRGGRR